MSLRYKLVNLTNKQKLATRHLSLWPDREGRGFLLEERISLHGERNDGAVSSLPRRWRHNTPSLLARRNRMSDEVAGCKAALGAESPVYRRFTMDPDEFFRTQ